MIRFIEFHNEVLESKLLFIRIRRLKEEHVAQTDKDEFVILIDKTDKY